MFKHYVERNSTTTTLNSSKIVYLTLGRTRKIHTPTVVKGGRGLDGPIPPPPRVFDMLQYFETIWPSVESL